MRIFLTCLLLALGLPATAQIYSYTDANGNTVYTNQPPEGIDAKTIDLPPTNSVAAQPVSPPSSTPDSPVAGDAYRVLQLTDIPDGQAMRANNGTFSVGVILQPALAAGHQLQLLLDGQPSGPPSKRPPLHLSNVPRGDHQLAVQVLSGSQVLQRSAVITFTVQRVNTQSPALRPKPTPKPAG
jgi:hypothetical protein